jgi:murein DD-endopeptidase MepM/ murein hydrolase activator NlpD
MRYIHGEKIYTLFTAFMMLLLLLASITSSGLLRSAQAHQSPLPQLQSLWKTLPQNPQPFMHMPYYGSAKLKARINSYFDHDEPWYANDGIFVRYDGKRWTGSNVSVLNCNAGSTCYDGHNGYDLHMVFEPVLSSAAGKVIRAGWYNAQNHSDSFGIWAAVDHGNGFDTVYGHLSALTVSVGQHVGAQWQIGTSGTTGSSTGPHLHFGTYFYPSWQATDPSGWKGNYTDPNTVPDDMLWTQGTNDTPVPLLGGQGKIVAPGAMLVDDNSPGWSHTGQWHSAKAANDIDGSLHWTSTTSGAASATATWQSQVPVDGYYEVGTFVDDNHASSGWASYTVYSVDPAHHNLVVKHQIKVDQEHVGVFQSPFGGVNTGAQWIGLGTYYFTSTQPGRVVLSNATGENGLQLSADAVEFAPLAPVIYAFAFTNDNAPTQMPTGGSATVNLTLQNTGNFPWQAQGQDAVQLVYRWLDSQGKVLSTSKPISLAQDLALKASEPLSVSVQAPAQAGAYTLQWDLVQEKRIFSKLGAQPKNDNVSVGSPVNSPINTPTPVSEPK